MKEYSGKQSLVNEIKRTADLFIKEFEDVPENETNTQIDGVERTPKQMIAYQLGWMNLLLDWDRDEVAGKEVFMPSLGYKWNQLGKLYQSFYKEYQDQTLHELMEKFVKTVDLLTKWLDDFSDEELFQPGGRKWASQAPSNWPIWKWVHINTVAPFKSFRSKIRRWKKLTNQ